MDSKDEEDVATVPTTTVPKSQKQDLKRADKIHPYRLKLWSNILVDDTSAESINFVAMVLSMVAILFKYKSVGWTAILVAAVAYGNARTSQEGQQLLSTFMLSITALVLCYITNPMPIAISYAQDHQPAPEA